MKDIKRILTVCGRRFLLKVENSDRAEDYAKYEELREEIWGFPEDHLPGTRNLMCENFLHDGGALFLGVFDEAEGGEFKEDLQHLAGFSYGFVGVKDKEVAFKRLDNLRFYSQYTGVREEYQGYGLGVLIKEFQREKVLDLFGIGEITCTYDPLTGVNAMRNIHHFGMEVEAYKVATYGEYGGLLNREDVPSDRFFMSWDLREKARQPDYDLNALLSPNNVVVDVEEVVIRGKSGTLSLEVVKSIRPDLKEDFLLVRIPRDFYVMLGETDVADPEVRRIPLDWRLKTRDVFLSLLGRGYRVFDFRLAGEEEIKNSYYVFTKR